MPFSSLVLAHAQAVAELHGRLRRCQRKILAQLKLSNYLKILTF